MFSHPIARWMTAHNLHYGWVVAVVTFVMMVATAAAMGSGGAMLQPLQQEFGWDVTGISTALSIRLLLFGLLGPFAAAFINHFGVRTVAVTALLFILVGILASFWMTEAWQLILLWGFFVGIGTGVASIVLGATVAARWFTKRRGLVLGLMTASGATGQLVVLPILAALTEAYGWRIAMSSVAGAIVLSLLMVLMLMVDHPSDVGLPAYGESKVDKPIPQRNSLVFTLANPLITLVAVTKSSAFWILSGSFFVCGLSTVGLVLTHWIPICGDFGITPVAAAGTLAVVGVFDFIGTIIAGWLSDRYDNRILLFCFYGVRVLTLGYLSFSSFGVIDLSFFAIVYGLDWVATVPPTVRLVADNFGREKAGLVFGWILASHQLGAAIAAYSAGVLKSDFGTYMPALQITALLCTLAALSVLFLRGPRYEDKVLAT